MQYLFTRAFLTIILLCIITKNQAFAGGPNYDCNIITPATVAFGTINTTDALAETITAQIGISCSATANETVNYSVTFASGGSGNVNNRRMTHSNLVNTLNYNISDTASHTKILGSGTGGTSSFSNNYSLSAGANQTDFFTIFGLIPVQASVTSGSYLDTILVTVSYN